MTIIELKNKLEEEKHIVGVLQIKCGRKCESPNILGIYEQNGIWFVYDTNDRGCVVVLDQGTEEDMTEALYRRVLKAERKFLKKVR